ncbi:hypothetical protein J2S37_002439 [Corynebacterium felinum]|uniref:Uncharacterized protein n=1 Tax=Corynebacterium felinum TaxID=131318 RepID=A0ABU2BC95_9CORY|nr:hypothetical protein [Corynebacterium felinum]
MAQFMSRSCTLIQKQQGTTSNVLLCFIFGVIKKITAVLLIVLKRLFQTRELLSLGITW